MNGRPVANQDARCDASEEGELVSRLGLVLLSSGDCSRAGCDQLRVSHRINELSFGCNQWLLYVGK